MKTFWKMLAIVLTMVLTMGLSQVSLAADADTVARQIATEFLKAMAAKNVAAIMKLADAPFVNDDGVLLKSKAEVQAYFQKVLATADPKDMPNEIIGVMAYEKARPVTDASRVKIRDQLLKPNDRMVGVGSKKLLCCYVLVKLNGDTATVVGMGN